MAHVHVGIPTHAGSVNAGVMTSIHEARSSRLHQISYQCMGLSLLARNFNSLWTTAYKRGAEYFVLHHADLQVASPYCGMTWIDLLIERMWQTGAAVLSVASPIKSDPGHLSAGLDLERGNNQTLRRITVRELSQLPKEFISRYMVCDLFGVDPRIAGALIVNTGLWIMDLRRFPWAALRWPGFNIVDTIEWSLNGVPQAFTEPEDWYASRWLFRHGLPYYMTREITLDHHGGKTYSNQGWWGHSTDIQSLTPSIERYRSAFIQGAVE